MSSTPDRENITSLHGPVHSAAAQGVDEDAASREWSRTESVHDQLRDMILTGEIPPGTVVSQAALARDLGTSRAPIREALRRLEGEGLVESRHNHRVQTADLSLHDMEEIYASRIALEALAVRFAVPQISRETIDGMRGALRDMRESEAAQDHEAWGRHHSRFHTYTLEQAGPRILNQILQLDDHANRYRILYMTQVTSSWSTILNQDSQILDAIEHADVETAVDRWTRHVASTALSTIAVVDPVYDPRLLRAALEGTASAARKATTQRPKGADRAPNVKGA